jgi:integration host factor subunit beta
MGIKMQKIRTLTKKDIAHQVANQLDRKLADAEKVVETVFASIVKLLMEADPEIRMEIRNFGVFEVKLTRPKPRARNPKTGEIVYVPARRKAHFKASKLMKQFLQRSLEAGSDRHIDVMGEWTKPSGEGS